MTKGVKKTYMTGICVENDFKIVADRVDQITADTGLSRSLIMRTVLFDFFGVEPENPVKHRKVLADIKTTLGRK